jgi:hypothetical protein
MTQLPVTIAFPHYTGTSERKRVDESKLAECDGIWEIEYLMPL